MGVALMLTFLTSAKAFTGGAARQQYQAFANWRRVCPEAEILLCGECKGAETVCRELNIRRAEGVKTTEAGIPYFESVAQWVLKNARHDVQVYANADILLPPDFGTYLAKVPAGPFLMVGQRVDLKENTVFDPDDFYEQLRLVLQVHQAEVHRPSGMDFFVFRRGMFQNLKPLIVGRGGYDSALVAYCLRKAIPVIDASFAFPVVHQWHDYAHVKNCKREAHYGEDAQFNFNRHGLRGFAPHCIDADLMMLRNGEIVPNRRRCWLRQLEMDWYYKRGWMWCPRFNQIWNIVTRGGKNIKNPEWLKLSE
jgi:hypothetical protein